MIVNDSISSLLTTIRTGQKLRKIYVIHYASKILIQILNVLIKEGYIYGYSYLIKNINNNKSFIKIFLKYNENGLPIIKYIVRVSKSSQRIYYNIIDLKKANNNLGIYILSTVSGILSDKEARKFNLGGEVLCKIFQLYDIF